MKLLSDSARRLVAEHDALKTCAREKLSDQLTRVEQAIHALREPHLADIDGGLPQLVRRVLLMHRRVGQAHLLQVNERLTDLDAAIDDVRQWLDGEGKRA